jgi:DNA-binding beta-propeller fold protein YncE
MLDANRWLVADGYSGRVRLLSLSEGRLSTVVGYPDGDDTPGVAARFARVRGLAAGVIVRDQVTPAEAYLSDADNGTISVIALVNPARPETWTIAPFAGQPACTFQDGTLAEACFAGPTALALSQAQDAVYVADTLNHIIRKVDLDAGTVSTVAGVLATPGFDDDGTGVPIGARQALLREPGGLAASGDGRLFIADTGNHRVVVYDPAAETVQPLIGDGIPGATAGDGPAGAMLLDSPRGLALDSDGNLFVASAQSIYVIRAGDDLRVDREDATSLVYGAPPRTSSPERETNCLSDIGVEPSGRSLVAVDACTGYAVRIRHTAAASQ